MTLSQINAEHPDYTSQRAIRRKYSHLYAGGEVLKSNANLYLTPRQKEPVDVYNERLSRAFYENYIGSIIDWYASTVFRREPIILAEGDDDTARRFLNIFAEDCDLKGTAISDFFRQRLTQALIHGVSYIAVDFPHQAQTAISRADEEASGASRGYLVEYSPDELINWSYDEFGNFEWVILRTHTTTKPHPKNDKWVEQTKWLYYDKEHFAMYSQTGGSPEGGLQLIAEGRHGFWRQGRVPVFELKLPDGLWLMNKAALLQLEHFNKSNALSWALTMGLFAMPVVYSDREWKQMVGDSYYIQLGPEDKFGWTEPEGHVFQIASDNLARLKEEIYRVCYLLPQAGGSFSSQAAQSGLSKQRDFAITQEVLRVYGDLLKDTIKRILRETLRARCDQLTVGVSGLDEFDIGEFSTELADAERLLSLGIVSPTLRKQVFKKLAFKYLCDVRQDVKDRIAAEIDGEGHSTEHDKHDG